MTLATVDADGRPAARYVLLRGLDERGFCFFTNYRSAKARELEAHPHAALTFGWLQVHRSVRVEGLGGAPARGRERRLLRRAPARGAHQRVGVAAERGHLLARGARARRRGRRAALRGRRGPAPAALGRLPRAPRAHRAVAGARGAPARSPALRARRRRLAHRAPRPVGLRGRRRCRGRRCRGRRGRRSRGWRGDKRGRVGQARGLVEAVVLRELVGLRLHRVGRGVLARALAAAGAPGGVGAEADGQRGRPGRARSARRPSPS